MVLIIKRGTTDEKIRNILDEMASEKLHRVMDAFQYCGVISLEQSPDKIQHILRAEWD